MQAQILKQCQPITKGNGPLVLQEVDAPRPGRGEVLLRVLACGVCHTELDEIEGRTPPAFLPMILGHQVIGEVVDRGEGVQGSFIGTRMGVAWIYSACGTCEFCGRGLENLCPGFQATGRDAHGGYAEYMVAPADFVHPIPDVLDTVQAAPLLCAGAIGYRSLSLTGLENGQALGLTGFGGSGHLVLHLVRHLFPDSPVHVFARSPEQRRFALELGAAWAGRSDDKPPTPLDAIIDTTPVWKPVIDALAVLKPGGRLVINAIRKQEDDRSRLLELDYERHLWMEKEIKSVANVCRSDVRRFLTLAAEADIRPEVRTYPLSRANEALFELKKGNFRGARVLVME